jgi:hypothetical protein
MTVDDMGFSAEKSTVLIFQQLDAIVKGEFQQQVLRSGCHPERSEGSAVQESSDPVAHANT